MVEMMSARADFIRSCASRLRTGDRLDKINSATFSSLTVARIAVARDVSCVVLFIWKCKQKKTLPLESGPST